MRESGRFVLRHVFCAGGDFAVDSHRGRVAVRGFRRHLQHVLGRLLDDTPSSVGRAQSAARLLGVQVGVEFASETCRWARL